MTIMFQRCFEINRSTHPEASENSMFCRICPKFAEQAFDKILAKIPPCLGSLAMSTSFQNSSMTCFCVKTMDFLGQSNYD